MHPRQPLSRSSTSRTRTIDVMRPKKVRRDEAERERQALSEGHSPIPYGRSVFNVNTPFKSKRPSVFNFNTPFKLNTHLNTLFKLNTPTLAPRTFQGLVPLLLLMHPHPRHPLSRSLILPYRNRQTLHATVAGHCMALTNRSREVPRPCSPAVPDASTPAPPPLSPRRPHPPGD